MTDNSRDRMESAEEWIEEWWPYVQEADAQVRRLAKEQPLLCLAAALAGGYVVGRIVSRLGG